MNLKNSLNAAKVAVTSKAGRQILVAQKKSPTIMFVGGVVGVVGTVVLASRATLQLDDVLDKHNEKKEQAEQVFKSSDHPSYDEKAFLKDQSVLMAKLVMDIGKLYAPACGVGLLSIGLLTGAHVVLNKRNAGLTAAYAVMEKAYREYRDRVEQELGPDKERELRYGAETREVISETEKGEPVVTEVVTAKDGKASPYARFFDECSKDWKPQSEYNLMFLRAQQSYANDMLKARGHLFLNEVYDMLGIDRTQAGAVVGWKISKDGDNFVDFGMYNSDNERARDFVNGRERSILLDFNVDGVVYDKI